MGTEQLNSCTKVAPICMKQLPNLISIFRAGLAIALTIIVLNNPNNNTALDFAFWITWLVIILDGIDGLVARGLKLTSDFGAFLDIACDRIVESIYISLFVILQWIPFWILIVFLVRGILVDGVRRLASEKVKLLLVKNQ